MLVLVDFYRTCLSTWHLHCDDFFGKIARGNRLSGTLLRAQRKRILVGACDLKFFRNVLAGFRHGIDAVLLLHQRIDEAPADRRVVNLSASGERLLRLSLYEWRARHRFNAAGDREVHFAGPNSTRGGADCFEARSTEAVQSHARHVVWQARKQERHARNVAVVFAGLIGAAIEDFLELCPIDLRITRHQSLDRNGGKIVRTDLGERAAVTADRGPHGVTNKHIARHYAAFCARLVRACKSRSTSSSRFVGDDVSATFAAYATFQPVLS